MPKPNILFIFADQVRPDALSCLGGAGETPALDAIAAGGYRFTNCYTPAPLCVPARICLATGRMAHSTGAWSNKAYTMARCANTWMRCIRDGGYRTALIGKTHLHAEKDMIASEALLSAYGYDEALEVDGPHANCVGRNRMTDEWKALGLMAAYRADMDARKGAMVRPSPLPLEEYYDYYVGREGARWLREYQGDQPWFCHVSFPGPHEPWDTPAPYADLYKPEDMLPPRPPLIKAAEDRPRGIFDELEAKPKLHCDETLARRLRADYAGGMKLIDDRIAALVDTLRARGAYENTIIVFTSDHGELNGDYGLIHKRNYMRPVVNVPLLISTPESRKNGGKTLDCVVSMADIGPTLAELSGNPVTYEQYARSLCPILRGECEAVRDFALSECSNEIMYADRQWKMVVNGEGEAYQLFDLENDPRETRNLAGLPAMRQKTDELRLRVFAELCRTSPRVPDVVQQEVAKDAELFRANG